MDISVVGAGRVGATLGKKWSFAGHNVFFGVREPGRDKFKSLMQQCADSAKLLPVKESASSANIVLLALPWSSIEQVVKDLDLSGKVVIDCTNAIASGFEPMFPNTTSAAEQIAEWATGAQVFKAFNCTGYNNMENPDYNGTAATMFYCGPEQQKNNVETLIADIGFEPWFVGDLTKARYLEPLALLWISEAMAEGKGRDIAFKMLQR